MATRTLAHKRLPRSDLSNADSAKRSLCAAVFRDPSCIEGARHHRVFSAFSIADHHHRDLLQLDVIVGCGGQVRLGGRATPISGLTLMITRPGIEHGYRLTADPSQRGTHVLHLKLRVDEPWHDLNTPMPLPPLLTGLGRLPALTEPMTSFIDGWTTQGVAFLGLVSLAEALASWPRTASERVQQGGTDARGSTLGLTVLERVRRAVEALGDRVQNPPDLKELARHALLSSRHFARLFREEYGCTPHDYLSARRLDTTKALLLNRQRPINDIAREMGFGSSAAFSRWFTRLAGQTARQFRRDASVF
jgi:AraC family transcriptional regulator